MDMRRVVLRKNREAPDGSALMIPEPSAGRKMPYVIALPRAAYVYSETDHAGTRYYDLAPAFFFGTGYSP